MRGRGSVKESEGVSVSEIRGRACEGESDSESEWMRECPKQ